MAPKKKNTQKKIAVQIHEKFPWTFQSSITSEGEKVMCHPCEVCQRENSYQKSRETRSNIPTDLWPTTSTSTQQTPAGKLSSLIEFVSNPSRARAHIESTSLKNISPPPPNTTPSPNLSIGYLPHLVGLVVGNQFLGGIVRQSPTFQSCNDSICGLGSAWRCSKGW